VISGLVGTGIWIFGEGDDENVIQGNSIGLDAFGNPLGNGQYGIYVTGASGNVIGGTEPGAGNVIAHNQRAGVHLSGDATLGNTVRGNSIFANGGLGIDLMPVGVTPNDKLDFDTGANDLQNYPMLVAVAAGDQTRSGLAEQPAQHEFHARLLRQHRVGSDRVRRGPAMAGRVRGDDGCVGIG
jgi:hypothetical protein